MIYNTVKHDIGAFQSDMVDQNILNFLPEREHAEVYKLLSAHLLMSDPISTDYLEGSKCMNTHTHVGIPIALRTSYWREDIWSPIEIIIDVVD